MSSVQTAPHVHVEPPEKIAARQLVGVWLFVAGDAVIVGSLAFTYLYLRGLNTQNQWIPRGVHAASGALAWGCVAVGAASGLTVLLGERRLRAGASAAAHFVLAALLALGTSGLIVEALRRIPQAKSDATGAVQVHGSYASSLLAIDVSNLAHFLLVALLGVGLAIRNRRGVLSASAPSHARFVRIFWLWVVASSVFVTALTTVFVASPKG